MQQAKYTQSLHILNYKSGLSGDISFNQGYISTMKVLIGMSLNSTSNTCLDMSIVSTTIPAAEGIYF